MCTVNNTGLRLSPCGVTIAIANEWQSLVNRRGSSDVAASSKLIGQPHIWQVWPECHRPRLLGRRSACLCLTSSVVIASGCRVDFLMKAGSVFMAESLNWRLKLSMSRTLKSKKTSGSLKVPYVGLQRNRDSNMPHCSSYACSNSTWKYSINKLLCYPLNRTELKQWSSGSGFVGTVTDTVRMPDDTTYLTYIYINYVKKYNHLNFSNEEN